MSIEDCQYVYYVYYVYEHWIDNKLFYIGKGKDERAFDFKYRNAAWKDFVNHREESITVIIKGKFKSEKDALEYEDYLIKINSLNENLKLTNFIKNAKISQREWEILRQNVEMKNKLNEKKYSIRIEFEKINEIEILNDDDYIKNGIAIFSDSKDLTNDLKNSIINPSLKKLNKIEPKIMIIDFTSTVNLNRILDLIDFKFSILYVRKEAIFDKNKSNLRVIVDAIKNSDIINKYLNRYLGWNEKQLLAQELNEVIRDKRRRLIKWPTIKKALEEIGYDVKHEQKVLNGERKRVSFVSDKSKQK